MDQLSLLQKIAIWTLPLLFGIIIHEVAHGWVANKLGDSTAKMLGRITLNPIKHIDPVGTILVPILMLTFTSFIFGWAKPVPVNWNNLNNPRRDMALVAIAGPSTNLVMALLWAMTLKLSLHFGINSHDAVKWIAYTAQAGVLINIVLLVLNMIPLPPLDGSRVVNAILPPKMAYHYSALEPYGLIILVVLIFSGFLGKILLPFVSIFIHIILSLFNL